MERNVLRRAGYTAGALVVLAGAIVLLRNADTPTAQKPPPPPPIQTTVREYTDDGVLAPQPAGKPPTPADLRVVPGPHRLQVTWRRSQESAGYEVQLHGGTDRTKLVTDNAVQFDALDDNADYEIQVRAVDSYGQRSAPATEKARPTAKRPDETPYTLIDHFDDGMAPDPARWRLANNAACARMSQGIDAERGRLVVSAACGNESVALRSRAPLVLTAHDGELGRVMIETDAPETAGELAVDLVPGPADLVETSPRGGMPPGTVRVRITPDAVTIGDTQPIPIEHLHSALSSRWEVVLRTDGVQVRRNGSVVGSAPGVPTWTQATALFEFTGPPNGLNFVGIDALGLSTDYFPAFVPPPRVTTTETRPGTNPLPGQLGGQLRMTIRSSYGEAMPGPFTVQVGNRTFPVRPAVDGQVLDSGLRYAVVADLPADALLTTDRFEVPIQVHSGDPNARPQVQHADLELTPDPAHPPAATGPAIDQVRRPKPILADIEATLLDAAGGKIGNGPSPSGRVILEVTVDGPGDLAGLAGVEIWVDNKRVAGVPTNKDGPGIAGRWRFALNTSSFPAGVRDLEVKTLSTDGVASPQFASIAWQIPA
ncbi:fibronectin type III domain-containing protein [Actinocrispum wychmicini]|uniref:Fibronectin type-III domain-containing protein n=1 Tax=Actinocrispum wychmicini TaxID=1213861 RepID=A0A4R2JX29_9PSEU|nr:fibronectin type III domain-containing protein [Actinocrispum wychmicini]TCO64414.1 hypothetical protein EV192_101184 [Actinocrispum wychmicini]